MLRLSKINEEEQLLQEEILNLHLQSIDKIREVEGKYNIKKDAHHS